MRVPVPSQLHQLLTLSVLLNGAILGCDRTLHFPHDRWFWHIFLCLFNSTFWTSIYFPEYAFSQGFSSAQFSHSVLSDSLWPHESQHARPPCPSPTPGVHSNSHLIPSSCPQSLPASESFPMSQLFTWDGQNVGVSALASVLPMNTQD